MGVSITVSRQVDHPSARVFLLHHAGGSRTAFRGWPGRFPAVWEVGRVEAPGRGRSTGSPPHRLDDFVAELLDAIPRDDVPYAVFGHSMGALAGFALALAAEALDRPPPAWLGLSAHPGPRTVEKTALHLHRLPVDTLREAMVGLGGISAEALGDDRVWSVVEPLVRGDLRMAETWHPPPDPLVISTPITAYCGADDLVAQPATVARWAAHTERFLGTRVFPGGHFYFRDAGPAVVAAMVADIRGVLTGRPVLSGASKGNE